MFRALTLTFLVVCQLAAAKAYPHPYYQPLLRRPVRRSPATLRSRERFSRPLLKGRARLGALCSTKWTGWEGVDTAVRYGPMLPVVIRLRIFVEGRLPSSP